MKRICIDMDEVLADTVSEHLLRYNTEHGASVCKDDLHGKWLWDIVPIEHQGALLRYLRSDDFFEELPVMPDAQRVVERLQEHYEIFVATAAMEFPNSFASKYRWLKRHFPFLPHARFVYCGDKSVLHADYLVDDMPRFLQAFSGKGVLFSSPHNLLVSGFDRVQNWLEAEEYFLPEGKVRK